MKKLIAILSAGCFLLASCSGKKEGGMSAAAKKNLDGMHAISKMFETKDFSKIGDYMTEDMVDHAGETGDIKGLPAIKAEFERMVADFDGLKSEVIREFADDEYVMSWMKYTAVLKKDMMGMKAGETMVSTAIEVAKCKDGKATEHWTFMEPAEMMKMMGGAMPPMENTTVPAKDTTSK